MRVTPGQTEFPIVAPRHRPGARQRRNLRNGLLFVSPWIVGFVWLELYPVVAAGYFSLTSYSIVAPPQFVGLDNYTQLFFRDPLFPTALYNTFYYAILSIPLNIVLGVAIALLLNLRVRGLSFYRAVYYLPTIVPAVASTMLWAWLLNPQYGVVNSLLGLVGIQGPGWFADPQWSKPALVFMGSWGVGSAMVIYLAGLQDIPHHLYEAAEIDGARWIQKTWHVTLPLLTPTIFFNLVMGMIGTFQYFTAAFVLTGGQGGPLDSTLFYALYLYNNAFSYFKMGYASAMAWILFVIVVIFTFIVFRSSDRWVFYQGGGR
jgi:multiple sugar transport system permease protein